MIRSLLLRIAGLGSEASSPSSPSAEPQTSAPPSAEESPSRRADRLIFDIPRRAASALAGAAQGRFDSIVNNVSGLGTSIDPGTATRPDTAVVPLSPEELEALARYNGYGARFIAIAPEDSTRKGWAIKIRDRDQDFVEAVRSTGERLGITEKAEEALRLANLYGGSALLIVTDDSPPDDFSGQEGRYLREPLDLSRVSSIRNLVVLDGKEIRPSEWDSDLASPGYGEPSLWYVSPAVQPEGWTSGEVHSTRLRYFYGRKLSRSQRRSSLTGLDDSALQSVWTQLSNRSTLDQGSALLSQRLQYMVLKMRGLADLQVGDQADAAEERFRIIGRGLSLLNVLLLDESETFELPTPNVRGVAELAEPVNQSLCAVTGMPSTKLFGDAPAGFNTDDASNERKWSQTIGSVQRKKLAPGLRYIYALIASTLAGELISVDEVEIDFAPLDEPTEAERADVRKTYAEIDDINVRNGVYTGEDVARSRFSDRGWRPDIDPVEVDDAPAEPPLTVEEARNLYAELASSARVDAAPVRDGEPRLWISIDVPRSVYSAIQRRASTILGDMEPEPEPHVTVISLGAPASALDEVLSVCREEVSDLRGGISLTLSSAGYFEPKQYDRPIVVGVYSGRLDVLNARLTRRLAHIVETPQHKEYRPHITLGYVSRERGLSSEETLAMTDQEVSGHWTAAELVIKLGDEVVGRVPLNLGRLDDDGSTDKAY